MGNRHYCGTNRKRYIFVWSLETNSLQFYCAYQALSKILMLRNIEYIRILTHTLQDSYPHPWRPHLFRAGRHSPHRPNGQSGLESPSSGSDSLWQLIVWLQNKTPKFCVILRSHFEASCGNLQTSFNFILWRYLDLWFGRSVHHGSTWQGIPNNRFFSCFMNQSQILLS